MSQKRRLQIQLSPSENGDTFLFDPSVDVPQKKSISDRRKKGIDLGLRVPSRKHDSFRVTDTSYTRQNIKIDHQGITSQDEEKTVTPKHESFIKDISEIKLLDVLGSGQSGYVSQGIHLPSQRMIAVKQISVYEKGRRNQIMNEFNALDNANCAGLVEFYGIFFSKGCVSIALEYCECGSLYDILKKVDFIPEEALGKICIHILNGLDILHNEKKQVHRDLKPSNICLNAKGEGKLTDFGISREIKDSIGKCQSVVGTVTYMSPERIRAESYSFKSDIWGFGLSIMECAIGKFPYPETPYYLEMIQYIANEPPPKLNQIKTNQNIMFSKEFQDFIYKCIDKDPSKRPNSKQLKNHPWIKKMSKSKFDMKQWIQENNLIVKIKPFSAN